MQEGSFLVFFLPLVMVVVMLGLGMALTVQDFRNVARAPKAVLVGLVCQTVILPFVCFGMVHAFGLDPALAVGMMLLAASPGGPTSNLYSHLAGGDVALSVTLTAVNSVLAIATLPLIANFSLEFFFADGRSLPMQFGKIMQFVGMVLVPMLAGMLLRRRFPALADRMERPVKTLSALFLFVVIVAALVKEWETFKTWAPVVGLAALSFNLVSLAIGYLAPRATGIVRRQAISISLEIGVHNAALAMTVAMSPLLLDDSVMAIPPAIYGLIAYFTAAAFVYLLKQRQPSPAHAGTGSVSG